MCNYQLAPTPPFMFYKVGECMWVGSVLVIRGNYNSSSPRLLCFIKALDAFIKHKGVTIRGMRIVKKATNRLHAFVSLSGKRIVAMRINRYNALKPLAERERIPMPQTSFLWKLPNPTRRAYR